MPLRIPCGAPSCDIYFSVHAVRAGDTFLCPKCKAFTAAPHDHVDFAVKCEKRCVRPTWILVPAIAPGLEIVCGNCWGTSRLSGELGSVGDSHSIRGIVWNTAYFLGEQGVPYEAGAALLQEMYARWDARPEPDIYIRLPWRRGTKKAMVRALRGYLEYRSQEERDSRRRSLVAAPVTPPQMQLWEVDGSRSQRPRVGHPHVPSSPVQPPVSALAPEVENSGRVHGGLAKAIYTVGLGGLGLVWLLARLVVLVVILGILGAFFDSCGGDGDPGVSERFRGY